MPPMKSGWHKCWPSRKTTPQKMKTVGQARGPKSSGQLRAMQVSNLRCLDRCELALTGTFLEHLDKLPGDQAMSGSKVTALLQSYMSVTHKLTGVLAEIRELVSSNRRAWML